MATSKITDLTLADYLKIAYVNGIANSLKDNTKQWEKILKYKKDQEGGKYLNYAMRTSYGAAAVGFTGVDGGAYPTAHLGSVTEASAQFKDIAATVEIERTIIEKAKQDLKAYGRPVAEEVNAKTIALGRVLAASLYQDGTGVIGTVSSVADGGTYATIVLATANTSRGFVGWFEEGDKVAIVDSASSSTITLRTSAGGVTPSYWLVVDVDRENNTVKLQPYDSSHAKLTYNGSADDIAAGDFIYRLGISAQTGIIPIADITVGTTDLNTICNQWVGFQGFDGVTAGHKVHNVTLEGVLKFTSKNAGGAALDSHHLYQLLSKLAIQSNGRYKYNEANCSWEAFNAIVEAREADRRFNEVNDVKRGAKTIGIVHPLGEIAFVPDEFCPGNRIYVLPEGGDAIQYHGSDFQQVNVGGQTEFLNPSSSGGYNKKVNMFLEGSGVIAIPHLAACGVLHNFTA